MSVGAKQHQPPDVLSITPLWPSLAALAIVGALSLLLAGIDLAVERQTAVSTAQLVDQSLRSVQLADDLRYQTRRLTDPDLDHIEVARITTRIQIDAREQAAIATAPQREVWQRLEELLAQLESADDRPSRAVIIDEIESNLDTLVQTNKAQATEDASLIRRLHQRMLSADVVAGIVTFVLIGVVGAALVQSLKRQRRLLKLYAASNEERARDLETFAARVAHDLRGPLAPIKGYASMLAKGDADVPVVAGRITRSVDKMARLLDDMLALSIAGRPPQGVAAVDPVLKDTLEDLSTELERVHAHVEVDAEPCTVECAPGVLSQLIHNILSNAIKYRAENRPLEIGISAHRSNGHVEISVRDNGVGMTRDATLHAFDPFFRVGSGPAPGHGLGLAIVKRAVDAVGGECLVESEPDRGTQFTLRLPASEALPRPAN